MQPVDWMLSLQNQFAPEDALQLMQAFLHEPLAGKAMLQEGFLERMQAQSGADLHGWDLATLALTTLDSTLQIGDLRSQDMAAIDNGLRTASIQAYETAHKTLQIPQSLAEAGLLALALRERRRLTRGWHGLANELTQGALGSQPGLALAIWKTPLACLFGMIPDGLDLCTALLPRQGITPAAKWINHMLLANPLSDAERVRLFTTLMRKTSAEIQTAWLREMNLTGEVDLVAAISQELLASAEPFAEDLSSKSMPGARAVDDLLRKSLEIQHLAELHYLNGQSEEAFALLQQVQTVSRAWLSGLNIQLSDLAIKIGQNDQAKSIIEQTAALQSVETDFPAELVMSLGQAWQTRMAFDPALDTSHHPLMAILHAEQMGISGELAAGQELARQAVYEWLAALEQDPTLQPAHYAVGWQPEAFANALINLDLEEEAIAFLKSALVLKPGDEVLVDLLSELLLKNHQVEPALAWVEWMVVRHPEEANRQRVLAKLLSETKRWSAAYATWKRTIGLAVNPQDEDWLGLAVAALETNAVPETIEICTRVLSTDSDSAKANSLLGKALVLSNRFEEAIPVLSLATLHTPDDAESWLLLAKAQHERGDLQKALETLRTASLAILDSAEINFELGSLYLEMNMPAEALPALRKAAQLNPESSCTAISLGGTLLSLGHYTDAQLVVSEAVKRWPEDCDLAYIHGKALLAIGNLDAATQALEIAIQSAEPEIDRYILLVETLLDGFTPDSVSQLKNADAKLDRAGQVLQSALTWMPEHFKARLLQAELHLAKDENQQAFDLYTLLLKETEALEPEIHGRIQAGLGLSAIRLGQVELAISALQDAIQAEPQNLGLHRLYAQASFQGNQRQEALQRARYALKLAQNDLENLLWFARLMGEMDETGEAINAMKVATQLSPERPELWLKRASLEVENGDLEAAQQSLKSMLALSGLTHEHYRTASLTYLRMQDSTAALNCLDRATLQDGANSIQLLSEMTCLNFRLGRMDRALENSQKLAELLPNNSVLQVLQADLLCSVENWTAALECLDRALEIWERGHQTGELGRWYNLAKSGWIDEEWLSGANRLGMVSLRKALIYYRMNEMDLARHLVEMSMQQMDKSLPATLLALDLAQESQDMEALTTILDTSELTSPELQSSRIELAVLQGKNEDAAELLNQAIIDRPRDYRLRLLQIRMLTRAYDWTSANNQFDRLLGDYKERKPALSRWPMLQSDLVARFSQRGDLLRMVEAALELRRWKDALDLAGEAVRIYGDAAAFLHQAQVLVVCAETQRLYSGLKIQAHAPGAEMITAERAEQFETAMQHTGDPTWAENRRWLSRGRAAYASSDPSAVDLSGLNGSPEDISALMAALRMENKLTAVRELAEHYPQQTMILAELALAQMENEPADALLTARHLVEISPSDPVHQSILAAVARQNQDDATALAALENALQTWPDEAAWHAWAAELADRVQAARACQSHWEQALTLQPDQVDYAMALARTYNARQIWNKAAVVLRRAVEIASNRPDLWMELATALLGAEDHAAALECAEKAAELLPEAVQPLLMCGKISLAMGKLDWALAYAQEANKLDAGNEAAVLFLARVMEKRGKPAEGLALIEKSLGSMDQSQSLVFEQARLIRRLNGPKAALPVLTRLASNQPTSAEALRLMAQVQAECGDLASAEKSARKALELNPEDAETNLLIGRLLHKSGQLDQAVQFLNQAIGGEHPDLEAFLELGRVYQARREFQQAMAVYQQAIQLNPKDHRMYLAAGTVLREAKDYRASEAMFRRAAELAPDDVNIQRQLGAVVALNLVYENSEAKFSHESH